MQKSMLAQISDGHHYSKTWPLEPKLGAVFLEFRVIKATKLAIKIVPLLAVLSIFVQVNFLTTNYLPQALTFSLFLLSMPVQGLYWLGKRANTLLPPQEAIWFREVYGKMTEHGVEPPVSITKPRYGDLAYLLKEVYEKMDNAFKRDLF
ncbi:terminus macrodomain insulation protein YfbV [Pseudoalteromonas sp.]|uniref:terminus macrodomain insulation protein YfbV n=1 Tax=Pseudoalteromonas sp. TaxID=53249 RepID=UPI00356661D5